MLQAYKIADIRESALNLELVFSVSSVLSMAGWLSLIASPLIPEWSNRIAGLIIPLALSTGYIALIVLFSSGTEGGYGSLADVSTLFSRPQALLAAWIHFLAFDLLIGNWMCRTSRAESIKFYLVLPCLPLTFLFGPAGFVVFSLVRQFGRHPVPGSRL